MEIRKILKKEIKVAAKKFTEFFYEYKAYDYFISCIQHINLHMYLEILRDYV